MDVDAVFTQAAQSAVVGGAAVTGLYVICRALRGGYRVVKRIELIHTTIRSELLTNHGTSIKDQIGSIEDRLAGIETTIGHRRSDDPSP